MTYLTTIGNSKKSYNPGEFNNFNVSEYLRSMQGTINLASKRFLKPFIIYGAAINKLDKKQILEFAQNVSLEISDKIITQIQDIKIVIEKTRNKSYISKKPT